MSTISGVVFTDKKGIIYSVRADADLNDRFGNLHVSRQENGILTDWSITCGNDNKSVVDTKSKKPLRRVFEYEENGHPEQMNDLEREAEDNAIVLYNLLPQGEEKEYVAEFIKNLEARSIAE